jgi:hypothetical protein
MLSIEAGTNKAGLGVGVAAFYVFLIIYGFGIDVCGVVFYSELFPIISEPKVQRCASVLLL